jgi:hypothetical protein
VEFLGKPEELVWEATAAAVAPATP